ncbi:Aspartate/glutamate/uridylate kinase [Venturia nashicola]|uniref:Aspartokinase n=1 Tax=Venturia nashicola TaxID=86259 RepID=A0A4Z1NVL0_9PEZI|nr:Aspartate/glutamate/uridylate kinase [Venturia nashicola]
MTQSEVQTPDWIVQKYGGTSLGKFPTDIAKIIETSQPSNQIAVIVSARSGKIKAQGTTTRLLQAIDIAEKVPGKSGRDAYLQIVHDIRQDHVDAAQKFIASPELQERYVDFVEEECQSLLRKLGAIQENCEITPMNENRIVCKGELLGAQFLVNLLEDRGVSAKCVDLSDTIRDFEVATDVPEIDLYASLATAFRQRVQSCEGKIPIITGYFGHLPGGILRSGSIGRGYSDLTAALIAVSLTASELQIWKEIDGIFTADPRKAQTARLLPSITPSEAAELTFYGSEVINSVAMQQVVRAQIPIRVLNVMKPAGKGTIIASSKPLKPPQEEAGFTLRRGKSLAHLTTAKIPKRPTAVTVKRSVVLLNVRSNRKIGAPGFLSQVFQTLDRQNLSAAPIASSEVNVSLGLHSEIPMVLYNLNEDGTEKITIKDKRLRKACEQLAKLGDVDIRTNMAILSLVGQGLKNMVGISGRFFSVLGEAGINVEMISQGASEINISCIICEEDADRALSVVHTHLFTFLE